MDFKMADTSERRVFCNTILLKYHDPDQIFKIRSVPDPDQMFKINSDLVPV